MADEQNNDNGSEANPDLNSPTFIDSIIREFSLDNTDAKAPVADQSQSIEAQNVPQVNPQSASQTTQEPRPGTKSEETLGIASQLAVLVDREAKLRAKEQELEGLRPKLEAELRSNAVKEIVTALTRDPYMFASTHGLDSKVVEQLAMDFYAMALGDAAPEELKRRTSRNETERLRAEFDRKVADLQAQQEQARLHAYALQVRSGYDGYVSAVNDSQFPYLANEVSEDRAAVLDAFMQVADMHYSKHGVAPSAAEVAAQLEANLAHTAEKFNRVLQKSRGTVTHNAPAPVTQHRAPPVTTISDQLAGRSQRELHPSDPFADAEARVQEVLALLGDAPPRR